MRRTRHLPSMAETGFVAEVTRLTESGVMKWRYDKDKNAHVCNELTISSARILHFKTYTYDHIKELYSLVLKSSASSFEQKQREEETSFLGQFTRNKSNDL